MTSKSVGARFFRRRGAWGGFYGLRFFEELEGLRSSGPLTGDLPDHRGRTHLYHRLWVYPRPESTHCEFNDVDPMFGMICRGMLAGENRWMLACLGRLRLGCQI